MRTKLVWIMALTAGAGLLGCGKSNVDFGHIESLAFSTATGEQSPDGRFFFPLAKTTESFKQDEFGPNTVTFQFEATAPNGAAILDLKPEDFRIMENSSVEIKNFEIESKTTKVGRRADIVFVIDSTGSMGPYINEVKTKVTSFVRDLEKTNIQASLCLVLFGDEIRRACDHFVEDNPATSKNENLESFLDAINRVAASGGGDQPENQLLAMITASATTPWHADAQRVAILITDAPFHYAPDKLGDAPFAPTYADSLKAVEDAGVKSFVVSPAGPGYNDDFDGLPSFVQRSEGLWFDLKEMVAGTISMRDIFNSIVERLRAVYTIRYVCENNPGSDPGIPDAVRQIVVEKTATKMDARYRVVAKSSTYPVGHPELKDRFRLGVEDVLASSLEVVVNGKQVDARLDGRDVVLTHTPAAGGAVQVRYLRKVVRENLKVLPIIVTTNRQVEEFSVRVNGAMLSRKDFSVEEVDLMTYVLKLRESVLEGENPYGVLERSGLEIFVQTK